MKITINTSSLSDYRTFLKLRKLPSYKFVGHTCEFPDHYASSITDCTSRIADESKYDPSPFMFDYQRGCSKLAIDRKRFAIFADCGLGKTLMMLDWARHLIDILPQNKATLIVSPMMVIPQTMAECSRWYNDTIPLEKIPASGLPKWCVGGGRIGITNFESLSGDTNLDASRIGAIAIDESSMLKSHYGKWGRELIRIGRGAEYKLCLTGTPAPNDRIEYANHAVFLGAHPSVNSFLARYFINRGQTENRWEIKPHAVKQFYRDLSHWCIFLNNPATYGWKDHTEKLPPIHVHVEHVELTKQQRDIVRSTTGEFFVSNLGGIASRAKLAGAAKGHGGGVAIDTHKTGHIQRLIKSFGDESSLLWCRYNREQDTMAAAIPHAASMSGDTPVCDRLTMVDAFKTGRTKTLISKPKILGFGLNLHMATRQVFSTLQDSYEEYYQCVKRSNRFGAKLPLNVHIPVTEIEMPMVQNVLRKADRIQSDTEEQEAIFNACRWQ